MLEGCGIIFEVDESVFSRFGIIRNLTGAGDTRDTIWILGGIDRTKKRNFFLRRVTVRTIGSLIAATMPNIKNDSILFTDGLPSYPSVAKNLNFRHKIVNHSEGFGLEDGIYTNNIEGFFGHVKSTMRKENGVFRDHIDAWLSKYTFKRRYTLGKSNEESSEVYIDILKNYFYKNY